MISAHKIKGDIEPSDFDLSFYENGFRYYAFENDTAHDMQSQIMMYSFQNTPEKTLLRFCEKAKVIGISATATVPSVIGNFDIAYLKDKMQKVFVSLTEEERHRLSAEFEESQQGYSDVSINVDLLGERLIPYLGEPEQKDMNAAIMEDIRMEGHIRLQELDDCISVSFDAGNEIIVAIGAKMQEMCESAYMNGYNWDAFINAYLEQNAPEILEEIDSDPEAEMYSVNINDTGDAGKAVAVRLKKILENLFDNEDEIFSFLDQNGDEIEWD